MTYPNIISSWLCTVSPWNITMKQSAHEIWVWVNTYRYIFSGTNIHKIPAILGFTRYQGFDPPPYHHETIWEIWCSSSHIEVAHVSALLWQGHIHLHDETRGFLLPGINKSRLCKLCTSMLVPKKWSTDSGCDTLWLCQNSYWKWHKMTIYSGFSH